MSKPVVSFRQKLCAAKAHAMVAFISMFSTAHAALPSTADPSNAAADGDYIGLLKGYAFDIAIVLGLVIGTIAFLAVAKNMIAVYSEIGAGKRTWGDMAMHGGMGVLLLVFVVYLLTEAAGIIF